MRCHLSRSPGRPCFPRVLLRPHASARPATDHFPVQAVSLRSASRLPARMLCGELPLPFCCFPELRDLPARHNPIALYVQLDPPV
jgi:hypothetical protein